MTLAYTWYIKYLCATVEPSAEPSRGLNNSQCIWSVDCRSDRAAAAGRQEEDIPFQIVTQFFLLALAVCFAPLFSLLSPCSSFSSSTLSAVCLWINAFEFPPQRDALWVSNERIKTVELTAINIWKIKGKRMDLLRELRVVVSVIKYTTNNNKSDTWQEKYKMILLQRNFAFSVSARALAGCESRGLFRLDAHNGMIWGWNESVVSRCRSGFLVWNVILSLLPSARLQSDGCLFFAVAVLHIYSP